MCARPSTLGLGLLLLRAFERRPQIRWLAPLTVVGAVPMFFDVLHLYVLKLLYPGAQAIWGNNEREVFGLDAMWMVWITPVAMGVALYPAVKAFAAFRTPRRDIRWLKYL